MSAAIVAAIRASRKRQQQCMLDEAEEQEEEPEAHANAQGDLCYNLLFTRVCAINDNLIGTAELLSLLQLIEPRRIRTMNTHHKLATDILTLARAHRTSSPPLAHRQPVRLNKDEFCQFLHTLLQSRIDEWLEQNVNCPLCRSNVLTTAALDAKKKNSGGIFSIRKSDSSATSSSCIVQ